MRTALGDGCKATAGNESRQRERAPAAQDQPATPDRRGLPNGHVDRQDVYIHSCRCMVASAADIRSNALPSRNVMASSTALESIPTMGFEFWARGTVSHGDPGYDNGALETRGAPAAVLCRFEERDVQCPAGCINAFYLRLARVRKQLRDRVPTSRLIEKHGHIVVNAAVEAEACGLKQWQPAT